jgi:hypothetical protein
VHLIGLFDRIGNFESIAHFRCTGIQEIMEHSQKHKNIKTYDI